MHACMIKVRYPFLLSFKFNSVLVLYSCIEQGQKIKFEPGQKIKFAGLSHLMTGTVTRFLSDFVPVHVPGQRRVKNLIWIGRGG